LIEVLLHLLRTKNKAILNAEFFIAKKITQTQEGAKQISGPIVKIAVFGIALGLAVMILSVAIITGFKNEVSSKVIGFGSHIQVTNFDSNRSYETLPINRKQLSQPLLNSIPGIKHSQVFITKSGIIKTKENIQAVILKGVDKEYVWGFFEKCLVEGEVFELSDSAKSNKILISERIANLLQLNLNDKLTVYFVQDPPRMRSFKINGIYKTSIEDFDKAFALVDLRHLQRINGWEPDQVSGYEIIIDDYDQISALTDSVFEIAGYHFADDGARLKVANIKQLYPQIFDWLNLQNINVWIILALMLIVAGFNMISGLLILILERTSMIGLLKGLGYNNWRIRKIFLYQSGFLISKGLLWGNVIGIIICIVQYKFGIVPLDEATYYIDKVPINLKALHLVYLNVGTLVLTIAMMIIPSYLITKISPAKAIKFN
jgi:lipoprotein-releasing system permease protein